MKRFIFFTALMLLTTMLTTEHLYGNDVYSVDASKDTIDALLNTIKNAEPPRIYDDCIVFTAEKEARFAGIVFEFEHFKTIHPFKRLATRNFDGEIEDSVLFYVAKIPPSMHTLSYRLVIDGLWTTDPYNANTYFDPSLQADLSYISVKFNEKRKTTPLLQTGIKFVYKGDSGKKIRLGGSFTNWDSWIYELEETQQGIYELTIPLPKGTWYYNFYEGSKPLLDTTNKERAYTKDGRIANVLTVE